MDPYEKYDMTFNGAVAARMPDHFARPLRRRWTMAGLFRCWTFRIVEFNKSIVEYPNKTRFPGGASNDMIPNLQNPENPLPYGYPIKLQKTVGAGGG